MSEAVEGVVLELDEVVQTVEIECTIDLSVCPRGSVDGAMVIADRVVCYIPLAFVELPVSDQLTRPLALEILYLLGRQRPVVNTNIVNQPV